MQYTTNRSLLKPAITDLVNIQNLNANIDLLDTIKDPVAITVGTTAYLALRPIMTDYSCDGIDDDVQIQAAIDLAASYGGGTVRLLPGVYKTNASIIINSNDVTIRGQGASTIIRPENFTSATENHIIRVYGEDCTLENFVIDGVNRVGGFGILPASAHRLNINKLEVCNCPSSAIYIMNSLDVTVQHCYVHNNQYSGITLSADNGDVLNAKILFNRCEYNGLCLPAVTGDRMGIHCEGWVGGSNIITGSLIHGNVCRYNGGNGIYIQRCTQNIISENNSSENGYSGLHILDSTQINVINNNFYNNAEGTVATGYLQNILISDYGATDNCAHILISHNTFKLAGEAHIRLKGNADFISIVDNTFVDKGYIWAYHAVLESTGTHIKYENNLGGITSNKGTATVASGSTSVVVTHGLDWGTTDASPSLDGIKITPTNSLGNATKFWVDNLNAGSFTINVDADPGATTATFVWEIKFSK